MADSNFNPDQIDLGGGNFINLTEMQLELGTVKENGNAFFLCSMGVLIFLMQGGFAFLEAGSVRSKNATNILIKNLLDSGISAICYWLVGYAFAFGRSAGGFIGTTDFALANISKPAAESYPAWFFQFTFAATAATIVSGALAERCEFVAYFAYCASLTGFVYPVITHWCWNEHGWLKDMGYMDFAGSGVVHLHGGTCALVGAIILGPRIGRFRSKEKPKEFLVGHSVPFAALGGFILMFGFFAFNGGSQASISEPGDGDTIARAMVSTMLNGGFSGLTVLLLNKFFGTHKWSILLSINAVLTGMVAACAGCDRYEPWAAVISGIGAAVAYLLVSNAVRKLRIDDPVDAVAVHAGGGLWGLLIAPVLAKGGIVWNISSVEPWKVLGVNLLAAVCIITWSAVLLGGVFLILHFTKRFRVSPEVEINGLDIFKHGEPSYPLAAYGHGWLDYEAKILSRGAESKLDTPSSLSAPNLHRYETPEVDRMTHRDENGYGPADQNGHGGQSRRMHNNNNQVFPAAAQPIPTTAVGGVTAPTVFTVNGDVPKISFR